MSLKRRNPSANSERAWYCLEFYDEKRGYHGFSAAYQTKQEALNVLYQADQMAPPTTAIYYWTQDDRPFPESPEGYEEGPLPRHRR